MGDAIWRGIRGPVRLEVVVDDIASQDDLDAVVNAANAELRTGGGVAGALHRAAGPGLAAESAEHAPIQAGECVLTGGHDLPNGYVVHCLGPVWGIDEPADELLASCYRCAIRLAETAGVVSLGFPAISTGAFGYPLREATEVAASAVVAAIDAGLEHLRLVRFVLYSDRHFAVYRQVLDSHLE